MGLSEVSLLELFRRPLNSFCNLKTTFAYCAAVTPLRNLISAQKIDLYITVYVGA